MISSRSSRNSSNTGSSMLATVCRSALLLIAFLGNHHVTVTAQVVLFDGPVFCRCGDIKDMCSALLASDLLVRAIIQKETKVGNNNRYDDIHYTAIVTTVFVNAQTNVAEGQTIEIRAGDQCGVPFANGDDMILDLSPPSSNGDYFSTRGCGLNSRIDSNGVIKWTDIGNCFELEQPLRLKGQSPKNVPQISPKVTTRGKRTQRQRSRKRLSRKPRRKL
eukprot:scaffold1673_cov51-Attheya_sp.AAC.1